MTAEGSARPGWVGHHSLLERLDQRQGSMRPSESKVAQVVAANPIAVVDLNLAGLAAAAQVSEPTVVRFCAALGFDGYRAFKIALAQAVALGLGIENSAVRRTDGPDQLTDKVFQRTISSLDRARRSVDPQAVGQAIELILGAKELVFLGLGASGVVALDAQQRFPMFGLPCHAPIDAHMQYLAASLAGPDTVLVAISDSARTPELLRAVQVGNEVGAKVVALTGNQGPLTELAQVEIRIATFEDTDAFTPSLSRLAALVVIDLLALGVALRRPQGDLDRLERVRGQLAEVRQGKPKPVRTRQSSGDNQP